MAGFTQTDINDSARRAKVHTLLRQAEQALVAVQGLIQLGDFLCSGPVGAGMVNRAITGVGDLRHAVKEGPDE